MSFKRFLGLFLIVYASNILLSSSSSSSSSQPLMAPTAPATFYTHTYPHHLQRIIENPELAPFFDPLKTIIKARITRLDHQLTAAEQHALSKELVAKAYEGSSKYISTITAAGAPLPAVMTQLIRHENNKHHTRQTAHRISKMPVQLKDHMATFLVSSHPKNAVKQPKMRPTPCIMPPEESKEEAAYVEQEKEIPCLDLRDGIEQVVSPATPALSLCAALYNPISGTKSLGEHAKIIYANDTIIVYDRVEDGNCLRVKNYRTGVSYDIPYGICTSRRYIPGSMDYASSDHFRNCFWRLQGSFLGVNASREGNYVIVDLKTGNKYVIKNSAGFYPMLAFNEHGSHVALMQKDTIELYETHTMTRIAVLKNTFGGVTDMVLSNNTTLFVLTWHNNEQSRHTKVYTIADATTAMPMVHCLYRSDEPYPDLVLNDKDKILVITDNKRARGEENVSGCVHIYDVTPKIPKKLHTLDIASLGMTHNYADDRLTFSITFMRNNLIVYDYDKTVILNMSSKKHISCDSIIYLNVSHVVLAARTKNVITIFDEHLTPLRKIQLSEDMDWYPLIGVNDTGTILVFRLNKNKDFFIINLLSNRYYKYSNILGGLMNEKYILLRPDEHNAAHKYTGKIALEAIEKPYFSLDDAIMLSDYDALIKSGDFERFMRAGSYTKSPSTLQRNIAAWYQKPSVRERLLLARLQAYGWAKQNKEKIAVVIAIVLAIKYHKILFGRSSTTGSMTFVNGIPVLPAEVRRSMINSYAIEKSRNNPRRTAEIHVL